MLEPMNPQEQPSAQPAPAALNAVRRSLWAFLCNAGSCNGCDIENVAMVTPRYDIERLGMKVVGSPRHADALLVTGPVTRKMAHRLRRVYDQMPDPKVVIAVGACAVSGGVFYESYTLEGPLDNVLPVDVYVPGCPPRPEAIIHGAALALAKLEKLAAGEPRPAPTTVDAAAPLPPVAPPAAEPAPAEPAPAAPTAAEPAPIPAAPAADAPAADAPAAPAPADPAPVSSTPQEPAP